MPLLGPRSSSSENLKQRCTFSRVEIRTNTQLPNSLCDLVWSQGRQILAEVVVKLVVGELSRP
eukprot:12945305-Alexandrium_andersonii.AAC.1